MNTTPHAAAAKAIRKDLKVRFPGIKFSVRSSSFSGGSSVRVSWTDGPTRREVEAVIKKYQYGHFDGMVDCYEISNSRNDIPQTKFVFADRKISPKVHRDTLNQIAKDFGIRDITDETEWFDKTGVWPQQAVYQELADKSLPA